MLVDQEQAVEKLRRFDKREKAGMLGLIMIVLGWFRVDIADVRKDAQERAHECAEIRTIATSAAAVAEERKESSAESFSDVKSELRDIKSELRSLRDERRGRRGER